MTTIIDWPSTRPFDPARLTIGVDVSEAGATGAYTNNRTFRSNLADRLVATLQLPPCKGVDAIERQGFLLGLRSSRAWVRLGMPHQPVPLGSARGTLTIGSAAVAGASSIVIAGATVAPNLLQASSSFSSAVWLNAWGGSSVIVEDVVSGYDGTGGGDKLTSSSGTSGRCQAVAVQTGLPYTFSLFAARVAGGSESTSVALHIRDGSGGGSSVLSSGSVTLPAAGAGYARNAITWTSDRTGTVYVGPTGLIAGQSGAYLWGAQFEQAAAASAYSGAPTLKTGDLLAVGTNTLLMVGYPGSLESGQFTVPLAMPLPVALAGGAPVAWSAPKGLWHLDADLLALDFSAGALQAGVAVPLRQVISG